MKGVERRSCTEQQGKRQRWMGEWQFIHLIRACHGNVRVALGCCKTGYVHQANKLNTFRLSSRYDSERKGTCKLKVPSAKRMLLVVSGGAARGR